jgi:hypothetical protein
MGRGVANTFGDVNSALQKKAMALGKTVDTLSQRERNEALDAIVNGKLNPGSFKYDRNVTGKLMQEYYHSTMAQDWLSDIGLGMTAEHIEDAQRKNGPDFTKRWRELQDEAFANEIKRRMQIRKDSVATAEKYRETMLKDPAKVRRLSELLGMPIERPKITPDQISVASDLDVFENPNAVQKTDMDLFEKMEAKQSTVTSARDVKVELRRHLTNWEAYRQRNLAVIDD